MSSPSKCKRSKSTESLQTGANNEWWVVHQQDDLAVFASNSNLSDLMFLTDEAPVKLLESWCGDSPETLDEGKKKSVSLRNVFAPVRQVCSQQRHRYISKGFDLDLTYVTSRIIAMGFPGKGTEAMYRNPRSQVQQFLQQTHGDHYRIYNLCAEPSHRSNGFPETTIHYPCADHCPPALPTFLSFCINVKSWLQECNENVIAVHCKAGKGRTGCMICALLLYSGALTSAYEALRWYEWVRGGTNSGLTIPAQVRWIAMWERWLKAKCSQLCCDPMGVPDEYQLCSLRVGPLPWSVHHMDAADKPPAKVTARVGLRTRALVEGFKKVRWHVGVFQDSVSDEYAEIELKPPALLRESDGEIKVELRRGPDQTACCGRAWRDQELKVNFWWHYAFLQRIPGSPDLELKLSKVWIDSLHKDFKKDKVVPADFLLIARFRPCCERPDGGGTATANDVEPERPDGGGTATANDVEPPVELQLPMPQEEATPRGIPTLSAPYFHCPYVVKRHGIVSTIMAL